ncbi:aminoglycoside phosphotransferase family protein [Quadrisphaera sp. KR29]|uniref:aminoglycoside phosphotransferase family protein n=1 Tax=Quadrisphaera sp. KR29 TaxID=3461391 RepID=UPI00404432C5
MERAFREHVLAVAADEGPEHLARAAAWLDELPGLVDGWRRHWRLGPLTRLPASIHWVGLGRREDGRGCVLKLAVPGASQPWAEVAWLRRVALPHPAAAAGARAGLTAGAAGAVRAVAGARSTVRAVALLDADPAAGAQLLELVEPGEPLADALVGAAGSSRFTAADEAACDVLAAAASAVRRPAPRSVDEVEDGEPRGADRGLERSTGQRPGRRPGQRPGQQPGPRLAPESERAALGSVREHLEQLFDVAGHRDQRHRQLPGPLVQAAADQARQLLATAAADGQAEVLLHGDLHHGNVLRAGHGDGHGQGGWVVIDPHGVVGEAAYEVACAVYNPFQLGQLAAERAVVRCEHLAGACGLPVDRVRGWALVQAVLSAVWSLAGHGGTGPVPWEVRHTLAVAERLAG